MKVLSKKEVTVTVKESVKNWTLNLTDIIKNSNKFYNIEVIKSDKDEFYLYTNYGRVGGTSAKEYRLCSSQADAEMEAFKIIKSKMKKGYNEVKLVKTDVGSELGKAKIQTSKISTDDFAKLVIVPTKVEPTTSSLHPQVQDLVRGWFGITKEFLELNLDTKKCPLGQLSLEQIVKGKNILEEAKTILKLKQPPIDELNSLTNKYYSNIPHNFGYRKIDANNLRFDSNQKIDSAISLLEIFENTKDFAAQLTTKSPIDDQYKTLNSDIGFIDPSSEEFSTIEKLISYTRATNHSFLGKIKLNRAFSLRRNNEDKLFISLVDEIAKKSNGRVIPSLLQKFWNERKDDSQRRGIIVALFIYDEIIKQGMKVSRTCKKCGWHKSYWKF
mgnify:CR=1 FL=1